MAGELCKTMCQWTYSQSRPDCFGCVAAPGGALDEMRRGRIAARACTGLELPADVAQGALTRLVEAIELEWISQSDEELIAAREKKASAYAELCRKRKAK